MGKTNRNVICDFQGYKGEKIDLSAIDAFTGTREDQKFKYIGTRRFSGTEGEVRYYRGILQMNTSKDKSTDMDIELEGIQAFSEKYLIL